MASISIALSKGRIFDETAPLLARVGIRPKENPEASRKLVIGTNEAKLSPGNIVTVTLNATLAGYCITASNPNATSTTAPGARKARRKVRECPGAIVTDERPAFHPCVPNMSPATDNVKSERVTTSER